MIKYPKSEGVLFQNKQRKTERHPDMRGHIEVSGDQIRKLIEMGREGHEVRLQVAAWNRESKAGMPYMYLSVEAYMAEEKPEQKDDFSEDDIPF